MAGERTSGAAAGRRAPSGTPRSRSVLVRLSEEEYDELVAAAEATGSKPTTFVAEAALSVARGETAAVPQPRSTELAGLGQELNQTWTQLARAGTNLNQAVKALNATGEPEERLAAAAAYTVRVMRKVEDLAEQVGRKVRRS